MITAFIAGLITFFAPCTLPLLPGYLGVISGVVPSEVNFARRKIFFNGLFFVLGFSIVFVMLGFFAGVVGQFLGSYQDLLVKVGGVLIILFGLFMLGVFRFLPFLYSEKKIELGQVKTGSYFWALIIGATFGFAWTPCIGPLLGSVLLVSATSNTVFESVSVLVFYSLGLALPFLFLAAFFSYSVSVIKKLSKFLRWSSVLGGVFLIVIGLLLLFDGFYILSELTQKFYDF